MHEKYLEPIIALAKKAGHAILEKYYAPNEIVVSKKSDNTPVTNVDLLANRIITEELSRLTPDFPVLSEEGPHIAYEERKKWHTYWLIDPLDGTAEFLHNSKEFGVNIALIENSRSIMGISYIPAMETCYYAYKGNGAFKKTSDALIKLKTNPINSEKIRVGMSKYIGIGKLNPFLSALKNYEIAYFGSSIKFCLLAEGVIDIYPRLGFNWEWDTAAGQCIVEEAGGLVIDTDFKPLRYNTREHLHSSPFLAVGDPNYDWQKYLPLLKND